MSSNDPAAHTDDDMYATMPPMPSQPSQPPPGQEILAEDSDCEMPDADLHTAVNEARQFEALTLEGAAKACTKLVAEAAACADERVAVEGCEAKAAQLKHALETGDIDARSGLGQRFTQWLRCNKEEAAKYKDLKAPGKTMQMKKEFRKRWAQQELEGCTTSRKSKLEEYQLVNEEMGVYEPFDMVVKHEGGRKSAAAWIAAKNYCEKCMELGGMWLNWNTFTQRTEVLYVKKQRRSSFNQIWALYQEKVATDTSAKPIAGEETPQKQAILQKGGMKALGGKESSGADDQPPGKRTKIGPSPADKVNSSALRAAQCLKTLFHKVRSVHTTKLSSLHDDPTWACLKTDANLDELKRLFSEVQCHASEDFTALFLNNDISDVKRNFKDDIPGFYYKVQHMVTTLEPPVKALDLFHVRMQRMYRASRL